LSLNFFERGYNCGHNFLTLSDSFGRLGYFDIIECPLKDVVK
jgi:hypothetical protein